MNVLKRKRRASSVSFGFFPFLELFSLGLWLGALVYGVVGLWLINLFSGI